MDRSPHQPPSRQHEGDTNPFAPYTPEEWLQKVSRVVGRSCRHAGIFDTHTAEDLTESLSLSILKRPLSKRLNAAKGTAGDYVNGMSRMALRSHLRWRACRERVTSVGVDLCHFGDHRPSDAVAVRQAESAEIELRIEALRLAVPLLPPAMRRAVERALAGQWPSTSDGVNDGRPTTSTAKVSLSRAIQRLAKWLPHIIGLIRSHPKSGSVTVRKLPGRGPARFALVPRECHAAG